MHASSLSHSFQSASSYAGMLLSPGDIPGFLALIQDVRMALPEDRRHFIKPRTPEDLAAHLAARHAILGIFKEHRLAAGALITPFTSAAAKNLDGYPVPDAPDATAVIQSVSVHPDYAGNGLGPALLERSSVSAWNQGFDALIAKIHSSNTRSVEMFERNGFEIWREGTDPAVGSPVVYMNKPLSAPA